VSVQIDTIRAGVTNIYLLRERGTVLVDPGGPTNGAAGSRKVLSRLGTPPRLDLMVITHGHFDHVAAAIPLREATGAPVAVHRADAEWLKAGQVVWPSGVTRWGKFARKVLAPLMTPFLRVTAFEPDLALGDDGLDLAPYGVTGRVVYTPGHTPGSVSVVLPSGEAFVGDLAMNGPPMCLTPSFGIFAHQPELVPESWRQLLALGVRTIYPAHGRPFPASALAA
jgi:hydroxyacylglutathione hydrolase